MQPHASTASIAQRVPDHAFATRKITAGVSDASTIPGSPRRATAKSNGCFAIGDPVSLDAPSRGCNIQR
jgi:hypothetical protein